MITEKDRSREKNCAQADFKEHKKDPIFMMRHSHFYRMNSVIDRAAHQ